MRVNKEQAEQGVITAIITFIVAMVGITIFNFNVGIYSGIASGLSVTVGKEYGDSLVIENSWHWKDIIPGVAGDIIGIIACIIFYSLK